MNQDQLLKTPLNLFTISTISKSLESIVTELYGPHGFKVLLSSATGHVIVTNDSACIFKSLHLSHPLAVFITQSLQKTLSVTFDNGKTFILYLSAMLDGIRGEFKLDSRCEHSEELKTNQLMKTEVSRLLHFFLQNVYPSITQTVQEQLIMFYEKRNISDAMGNPTLKGAVKGVLSPHFTPKLTDFFTEILHEMLLSFTSSNDFLSLLQLVSDNFNIFHCKTVNQPYTSSRCINTMIIQRDFTVYCGSLTNNPLRFILCQFSINMQTRDQSLKEIISIRSANKANSFITHQLEKLKLFLDHCIEKEISLILSSEKFPDYALHLFRERNISLVHCVLEEDLEFIKIVTKCQALLDISEKIDDLFNIAHASSCSLLDLGTRFFIHLNIGNNVPKSVILSAPTDGLCSNVALIIHKALKCLLFSLKSSTNMDLYLKKEDTTVQRAFFTCQNEITVVESSNLINSEKSDCLQMGSDNSFISEVFKHSCHTDVQNRLKQDEVTFKHEPCYSDFAPGGGALDFMIAKVLSEVSCRSADVDLKMICKIVQNATLRIPKILHFNNSLCSPGEKSHEFQKLQMDAFKKLDEGEILGINSKGVLTNMLNHGVFESIHCKFYVMYSVIQTLIQILKMDFIVGVNKINK